MRELKRVLAAMLMTAVIGAGVFAQKGNDDNKRPPKEPNKVKAGDKGSKPPPKGDQGNKNTNDKRGKP